MSSAKSTGFLETDILTVEKKELFHVRIIKSYEKKGQFPLQQLVLAIISAKSPD